MFSSGLTILSNSINNRRIVLATPRHSRWAAQTLVTEDILMGRSQLVRKSSPTDREEPTCWREVLFGAISGLYPNDQQIDQMLDDLERTS